MHRHKRDTEKDADREKARDGGDEKTDIQKERERYV